ncbi:MAG TPA: DUF488 domain-containing protein [Lacipirellulaceae bacterium]|nr:DUF488 domain-containing protein [Lacipirellulaceae bacterium]
MFLLFTIGHSNRSLAEFLALLTENGMKALADVRRFPGSRRYPQFSRDTLARALEEIGILYKHFPALGGRRTERNNASPNNAWRVAAFAAYADYMLTDEFDAAFAQLTALAQMHRTAIMCAEALPWRCHRRLIADQFVAGGWAVHDIIGPTSIREHMLPPFATIAGGRVTYPGPAPSPGSPAKLSPPPLR